MSLVPSVQVLRQGWVVRDGAKVVGASSSVVLVRSGSADIVVDTGSRDDAEAVTGALAAVDIHPEDVSHVVNTHLHMDHCGCNDLFTNALFHAHGLEEPPVGTVRVSGEVTIAPGVRLVPTPGHTAGSVSVFVESDRRYAICGDAIPPRANYEARAPPAVHIDRSLAMKSMDVILAWAEVVIPGHDRQFNVLGKK